MAEERELMFRSRYTRYLESEVDRLRLELDKATLERQAAVNSLLAHIGAPTMNIQPIERKAIPVQRARNLPSIWRRTQELCSRMASTTQELKHKGEVQ